MYTKRHKKVVTYTLNADLVDEFRIWVSKQEPKTLQNAVVEIALRRFLSDAKQHRRIAEDR